MSEPALVAAPLRLVAPPDGGQTGPLQAFAWPELRPIYAAQAMEGLPLFPLADRGLPRPVRLAWERNGQHSNKVAQHPDGWRYDVQLSTNPDLSEARMWAGLAQNSLEIHNLQPGRRYFWKVIARGRDETASESGLASFSTHPALPRWIQVEGITNCRDVGGWACGAGRRVRLGRVFRSSELNSHFNISPAGRRLLLDELGIRTDLDLRGEGEETLPSLDPRRVKYVNAPVGSYEEILGDFSKAGFLLAFETLGRPENYPLLAHCWGGADRTGTFIFLLNGLLGVGLADLIHDYEATSLSVFGPRLADASAFQSLLRALSAYAVPGAGLEAQIEHYLLSIGVKAATLAAICSTLTESS